ncbi:hypothetical protein D477_009625 [Arthrobacter crystallopoietes BAB-32]|uniref:Uncharacterized protein n=1 Tax=Arthrobacter crystallopoietes BAB-32 TaxID=1246476 RepID=N1UZD9_9MICC|nr:hypothetical protein [Arthrobacter crystallopoietes]EMY34430.1 hypothetical protein D477_009625 [Arthrobacter crystallopoietes BAB-32]
MQQSRHENWNLMPGTLVEVRRRDKLVRSGRVDAVSPDAELLWLASDGPVPRQLFEKAEGYELWSRGQEENASALPVPDHQV